MEYRDIFKRLSSVCDIQSGFTTKRALEPIPEPASGGVPAIQLRDISNALQHDLAELQQYELEGSLERYTVQGGDVLFRSRGQRNEAVLISPKATGSAVAIQPLLILRPDPTLLDPHFLAWSINQPKSQRHFDSCARGTNMRMIPKRCLEELMIAVPALEIQKQVTEISLLAHQEHSLAIELAEKKLKLTNFALLEQVQNARPHGTGTGRSGSHKPSGHVE